LPTQALGRFHPLASRTVSLPDAEVFG
jgi:hypothetical protein